MLWLLWSLVVRSFWNILVYKVVKKWGLGLEEFVLKIKFWKLIYFFMLIKMEKDIYSYVESSDFVWVRFGIYN